MKTISKSPIRHVVRLQRKLKLKILHIRMLLLYFSKFHCISYQPTSVADSDWRVNHVTPWYHRVCKISVFKFRFGEGGCNPAASPPPLIFTLITLTFTQIQIKIKILFKTFGFRSLSEGIISQDIKERKQTESYRNLEKPKRPIWPSCTRMQQGLWLYHRYPATCAGFRLLSLSLSLSCRSCGSARCTTVHFPFYSTLT